jgi:hypothetical protein
MKFLFFLSLLLVVARAIAHPPVGIVCDSKGNIYYSDLEHVWKLEPSGRKTIAVRNVHTHELYIDVNDNLYGQHSVYSGETSNKWYYSIWRLSNSRLDTIVPLREGFYIENYSFARDSAGNMYWIRHLPHKWTFMKTTPQGATETIADGDFEKVQWIHPAKGKVYYVNLGSIYSMDKAGTVKVVAAKLTEHNDHNSLFGLWSDNAGNLYVANRSKRVVQKISEDGNICVVYKSGEDRYPTGGTFDKNGNMWVLEADKNNQITVTKSSARPISPDK